MPLSAHQRQSLPVCLEVHEAEDMQKHISRQRLYGAMVCLQVALLIRLECAPALLGTGTTLTILLAVFPDLGVAAHCTQKGVSTSA